MRLPWFNVRTRATKRLWFIPALYVIAAWLLGNLIPNVDVLRAVPSSLYTPVVATSVLSAIASGMIAFTGIVFSMAFLMIQFGSTAYSPRLAGFFLQDRVVRHALGAFIATFLYALVALAATGAGSERVGFDLSVRVGLLAVLFSVIMFLALMQRVTTLQVGNVLHSVGDHAREVIETVYPQLPQDSPSADRVESAPPDGLLELPATTQSIRYYGGPMAVVEIDLKQLLQLARRANAVIEVEYPIGDTVPNGATLLRVRGGQRKLRPWQVRRAVMIGRQRTIDQDPLYAMRLIVDIAIRALSPAVNDPTTAVQAIDQLDDLLRRVGGRQLDVGYVYDQTGALRVVYPTPHWEDFLTLAVDEIRSYGATSIQVMRRLRALLEDLREVVPPDRRVAVEQQLIRINSSIDRSFPDVHDRHDALQADRQGIGISVRLPDDDVET
jgi:uncharacterized membrane protein